MPLTPDHFADAFTHGLLASWAVMGAMSALAIVEMTKPPAWLRDGF